MSPRNLIFHYNMLWRGVLSHQYAFRKETSIQLLSTLSQLVARFFVGEAYFILHSPSFPSNAELQLILLCIHLKGGYFSLSCHHSQILNGYDVCGTELQFNSCHSNTSLQHIQLIGFNFSVTAQNLNYEVNGHYWKALPIFIIRGRFCVKLLQWKVRYSLRLLVNF